MSQECPLSRFLMTKKGWQLEGSKVKGELRGAAGSAGFVFRAIAPFPVSAWQTNNYQASLRKAALILHVHPRCLRVGWTCNNSRIILQIKYSPCTELDAWVTTGHRKRGDQKCIFFEQRWKVEHREILIHCKWNQSALNKKISFMPELYLQTNELENQVVSMSQGGSFKTNFLYIHFIPLCLLPDLATPLSQILAAAFHLLSKRGQLIFHFLFVCLECINQTQTVNETARSGFVLDIGT